MGDPKKAKKTYQTPGHPYRTMARFENELELVGRFGLRNKRELWKARTILRKYRRQARAMLSLEDEERIEKEKILIRKLATLGILPEESTFEDVLSLKVDDILKRRLQTLVYEKGLAKTPHQARQMITHRHILVNGRVMTTPGYLVPVAYEDTIQIRPTSPFADPQHPEIIKFKKPQEILNEENEGNGETSE